MDDRPVACLGWDGAAWKVACRDTIIGWDADSRKHPLLADDWYQFYAYPVVLAETFIDGQLAGTCYKASNFMYAGDTKSRGKYDRYNQCAGSVKAVFLYHPCRKTFRRCCGGRKPVFARGHRDHG